MPITSKRERRKRRQDKRKNSFDFSIFYLCVKGKETRKKEPIPFHLFCLKHTKEKKQKDGESKGGDEGVAQGDETRRGVVKTEIVNECREADTQKQKERERAGAGADLKKKEHMEEERGGKKIRESANSCQARISLSFSLRTFAKGFFFVLLQKGTVHKK